MFEEFQAMTDEEILELAWYSDVLLPDDRDLLEAQMETRNLPWPRLGPDDAGPGTDRAHH